MIGDHNSNEKGTGARENTGKAPLQMVPLHLLEEVGRVYYDVTISGKYKPWNWAKGMAWTVPYACILRHLAAWFRGEDNDPETGYSHMAHVICNALMLLHYRKFYPEGDDRPKEFFQ